MRKFHSLRVAEVQPEAEDAVCITLDVPQSLRDEFRAQAGQHIVLRAQLDGEEVRRTYSLLNAAGELPLRIAVRVHPKGSLSRHLAARVRRGDTLEVMPPNGSFGPHGSVAENSTYVTFASGCGITPVLSIIKTLLARSPSSRVLLFYGNRGTGRTMLIEELLALKDRYLDRLAVHFIMSGEPQEVELFNGRLDGEKVRALAQSLFDVRTVADYFICGPGTMIDDVTRTLRELGAEPAHIHAEHFTLTDVPPQKAQDRQGLKTAAPQAVAVDEGITQVAVIMDGRRKTFTMRTRDESILDAAARAGLDLPFSCKAGVCSTCRTKLVRGEVELAQNYALEDWELEQGFILACQAHAKTPEIELNYDEN